MMSFFIGRQAVLCTWQLLDVGATYYIFNVFLKDKCYLCIRMGITMFKIFIWQDIPPQMKAFNTVIPLLIFLFPNQNIC